MHALDRLKVTVLAEDSVGYETPYLGQHGISLLLDAGRGATTRRVLIDVAQHPDPLLFNMEQMGIEPATIDTIVLTHCHYDHTRGLARILEMIGKDDVPVVAHPDVFRLTFITDPYLHHIGIPASDSGEIERTTDFEAPEMELRTIRDQRVVADEVADDMSVLAVTRDSGAVGGADHEDCRGPEGGGSVPRARRPLHRISGTGRARRSLRRAFRAPSHRRCA
ncbi:MAG: MBL fold metallo-hydrolase [Spirochaetes bacterium]|jgi:7,8-dihydropterin-6-yl-methyl-4-(beta-D-ribofuranosyl)aminobenzene 5'-phosphate synthase|nr:MBL fold metallo-hydrolase [Spirochaetota bacterium]